MNEKTNKDFMNKIQTVNISRKKFIKGLTAAGGIAALGPLITACNNAADEITSNGSEPGQAGIAIKKDEPMIAMFSTLDNNYYKMWNRGAEQAVAALDMKYDQFVDENDPGTQLASFETLVPQQDNQMFFITTPGSSNILTIAQLANENQTYMTNTWNMPDWTTPIDTGDYYVTYFTPNSIEGGYKMAKILFEEMGGKGKLAQVSGFPGHTADWQRTVGLERALEEYPDIELVASQPGNWNRSDSQSVMEDILSAHPDIDGVYAQNDDTGIGAMQALEERGMKGIPITGNDGNEETMELIQEGRFTATLTSHPFWQAGYSAVRVYDAFHGWEPTVPERMMYTGDMVIDKNNVDAYHEKFYTQEEIPIDWKLMSRVLNPDDWDPQNNVWPLEPESMWGTRDKPSGYRESKEIKESKDSGEWEEITQLYEQHYKKKILE
ncbi:sugar ABC transporter substrate-binding protein [Alteribacillus sp. YIM 98480]|uniref:sugar ABC transporter substrate-binding protein n=1 Tax=Alteribacillus sp. YIM 98480 TaxID=2606599 RepID=UPI00131E4285|nr:sugar ABC transporter substrate-binding protein [Alteribacillus sp. YIM 98480]